jgi:hypothetical protein
VTSVLKGVKPDQKQETNNSKTTQKGDRKLHATSGVAEQELLKTQDAVDARLRGLETASNHFVAQVLANEAEALDRNAEELAEAIETYRNPQLMVALAYLKATQRLADNKAVKKYLLPSPCWQFSLPSVDSGLDYSHLALPHQSQSVNSDNLIDPSRQIAASTDGAGKEQVLNGSRATAAGKGFSGGQKS